VLAAEANALPAAGADVTHRISHEVGAGMTTT